MPLASDSDNQRVDELGAQRSNSIVSNLRRLISGGEIASVDLWRNICELLAPAVGDDEVATPLENRKVERDLETEERRIVQCGLIDHRHALGLHAFYNPLDRESSKVVGTDPHSQTIFAAI